MIPPEKLGMKRPKKETVIYWVERRRRAPGSQSIANEYRIQMGLLDEIYPDMIVVKRLDVDWMHTIDDIPVEDFVTPTEWRKLPKDWSWDTRLFEIKSNRSNDELQKYNPCKPKDVLDAYHAGVMKFVSDIDYSKFSSEITKEGWRIVRDIYQPEYHPATITLRYDEAYLDGWEAWEESKRLNKELECTVTMTDHEFNIYDLDNLLNSIPFHAPELREKYREKLLAMPDFDDLEFRYSCIEGVQWKHWKKRKWNCIQLDDE